MVGGGQRELILAIRDIFRSIGRMDVMGGLVVQEIVEME